MSDNFHLMKVQYELLNRSAKEIAAQNNTPISVIEMAIDKKGWKRQSLSKVLGDLNEEEDTSAVIDQLALLKEAALLPQYIEVETALLAKLIEMLETIPLGTRVGAEILQKIEKVFSSLSISQGMISRVRKPDNDSGNNNEVKIQILNTA